MNDVEAQMTTKVIKLPQYTATFLAGVFDLTQEQARLVLARSGDDRVRAAEGARLQVRRTGERRLPYIRNQDDL